jgi:rubrerythrin
MKRNEKRDASRWADAAREANGQTRPCPSCPDGNVWGANGPTGAPCPTCNGHGVVFLDGSAMPRTEVRR